MSRHQARETAFRMIFQMDVGKNDFEIAKETMLEALVDEMITQKDYPYIEKVVLGVEKEKNRLDDFIIRHARGWSLQRMNPVEKNILRMALYEIWFLDDVPYEVAMDEGVELAKVYGDEDAYGFVNAILDNAKTESKSEFFKVLPPVEKVEILAEPTPVEKLGLGSDGADEIPEPAKPKIISIVSDNGTKVKTVASSVEEMAAKKLKAAEEARINAEKTARMLKENAAFIAAEEAARKEAKEEARLAKLKAAEIEAEKDIQMAMAKSTEIEGENGETVADEDIKTEVATEATSEVATEATSEVTAEDIPETISE
ncbi:MAG: transcription antitermination factor NusB, partial [Clostridiales bacterium]